MNKDMLREAIVYISDECRKHKNCEECKFYDRGEWRNCYFGDTPNYWQIEEIISSRSMEQEG